MFTFKPKKVFEKLNKMDRKQAYTIGAIAVVSFVALLMLISAATGTKDESFDGMTARGYDLAQMPFATDEAEKYLLASKYPDMRENGSTLLYSAEEKQARQEEDAKEAEESAAGQTNFNDDDNTFAARSDNGGYGGYQGGYGGSRGGRGKTEVGQLGAAGMASAGGSGVNSTWGPTGDFRQFKGREDRGREVPIQLKTGDARQALAQFRQGSRAAASFKENKMTGARKALMGGNVAGSEAITKDGVDLSKLQNGGLTLDTDAPPTTTDLDNLDKQVADAAKKAEDKKNQDDEDKLGWLEKMLMNLAQRAAEKLVDSLMNGVGNVLEGAIAGKQAQYTARKQANTDLYNNVKAAGGSYEKFVEKNGNVLSEAQFHYYDTHKLKDTYTYSNKEAFTYQTKTEEGDTVTITVGAGTVDMGKRIGSNNASGDVAKTKAQADAAERAEERRIAEETRQAEETKAKAAQEAQINKQRNDCVAGGKTWNAQTNTCN